MMKKLKGKIVGNKMVKGNKKKNQFKLSQKLIFYISPDLFRLLFSII